MSARPQSGPVWLLGVDVWESAAGAQAGGLASQAGRGGTLPRRQQRLVERSQPHSCLTTSSACPSSPQNESRHTPGWRGRAWTFGLSPSGLMAVTS